MRLLPFVLVAGLLGFLGELYPCAAQQEIAQRPKGTLVRPENGVGHPDLDMAWDKYDATVADVTGNIRVTITDKFNASTQKRSLDMAEKWQQIGMEFDSKGEIPDAVELRPAVVALKKAKNELTKAYEAVEEALTFQQKLADARAVRGESEQLLGDAQKAPNPRSQPPTPKPSAVPILRNSIGVELRLIPAGTFMMGSVDGEKDEQPVHLVRISKPFYLGQTEVTNDQWKAVMGSIPSKRREDTHPVDSVTWEAAAEFCRKLSELPDEQAAGRVYRLPTEAEWEYACRGGTFTRFHFGNDASMLGAHAWIAGNSDFMSHPVGQKKPNQFGLFDMYGNLLEWCSDWHGSYQPAPVTDPKGPQAGERRVYRGGCFNSKSPKSSDRESEVPLRRNSPVGFRVSLSPPEAGR